MPRFAIFSRLVLLILLAVFAMSASASAQSPLSTAIPYQGQLTDGGAPATGQYDFEFKLFDAASAGSQVGSTNSKENVQVANGLFAVELDFGGSAFTGAGRFLEIGVRAGTSTGAFTALTPRRPLLAVPYALYSPSGSKPAYGMDAAAPNNAVYVAANGLVGIGTTNPRQSLNVSTTDPAGGTILISNPTIEATIGFIDNVGTHWVAGSGGWGVAKEFVIGTGSDPAGPKLTILRHGNVGIGTTGPQRALHVNTTNSVNGALLISNPASATSEASIGFQDGDGTTWVTGIGAWSSGDNFVIGSVQSGPKFYIEQNGHVSIAGTDLKLGKSGRALVYLSESDTLKINHSKDYAGGTSIDGNVGINGGLSVVGHTSTQVLQITGGADLAEPFTVTDPEAVEPGTVVVLDADHPGQVRVSATAYDTMVAGIVSGAGGINPGLVMNQEELAIAGESHPVALTGKVYVKAVGPIQVGDLLTTSALPGHAMAATDRDRAFGATLGKAMSNLDEGTGLVLVLVSLQ